MSGTAATRSTRPRSRIGYCQRYASAPFRALVPADPHWAWRFCTSTAINHAPTTTNALDGSINRYYDPATGQFMSVDPLVAETGQPYEYTGDDPVNAVDPLGLFCILGTNPGGGCRGASEVKSAVNTVGKAVNTVIQASPVGQAADAVSRWTGLTIGGCIGLSLFWRSGRHCQSLLRGKLQADNRASHFRLAVVAVGHLESMRLLVHS
jgi:RHS repeat-associated protein